MDEAKEAVRLSEWIMWGTPFAILGLGWVMKVKTERIVKEESKDLEERRDVQRKSDKKQIFDKIHELEHKQNEHDNNIGVLLERSSYQAEATKRIDGHIKELGGKMDDLKDLLIKHLGNG